MREVTVPESSMLFPETAISRSKRERSRKLTRKHGNSFESIFRALRGKCTCHHVNGLLIQFATIPAITPSDMGARPPPTRSCTIERIIRINPPFFSLKIEQPIEQPQGSR